MFLDRLLKPRQAKAAGGELYASAVAQARRPPFYLDLRVPDTREGRFELYTLHIVLLVDRLKRQGDAAAETSQAVFDAYVRGLDDAFREIGVGDLSVPKKMKKLGGAFYGRLKSYQTAFETLPDRGELESLAGRIIPEADAAGLAAYIAAARDHLAAQPTEDLLTGCVSWPEPL